MELITDRKSNTFRNRHTSTNKNFVQIVISNVPNYKPRSSRNETCYVTRVSHTSTNDLFPRRHRCVSHELVRDYKTAAVVTYHKSPLCQDEILDAERISFAQRPDTGRACNVVTSNSSGWNHHQDGNFLFFLFEKKKKKKKKNRERNFTFHFDVDRLRVGATLFVLRRARVCTVIGASVDVMQHQRTVREHFLTSTRR